MELQLPRITMLYAGVLGIFYFILSVDVIRYRWKEKKGLGHGTDPESGLYKRIRIHGNFMEYIPFILLLMALDELTGRSSAYLHFVGAALFLGRVGHSLGLKKTQGPSVGRTIGMGTTFCTLLLLCFNLIFKSVS
ncbi:MAG TPA: MAPEG family protein [Bacteriovoracaceae bacterium]|nr:MAPEG family protein [Bacteriovoracaceae bacterium]